MENIQYNLASYSLHVMLCVCYGVCFLTYLSVLTIKVSAFFKFVNIWVEL